MKKMSVNRRETILLGRLIFVIPQLMIVFLMMGSFGFGTYTVYLSRLGAGSTEKTLTSIPVFFLGLGQSLQITVPIAAIFAALTGIYLILMIIAIMNGGRSMSKAVQNIMKSGVRHTPGNTMLFLATVFPALSLILIAIEKLQEAVGIPTGSLVEIDPIVTFTTVSIAPITEEIGFRMTIIGLLASAVLVDRPSLKQTLRVLWRPSSISNLGSGNTVQRKRILTALITFSALSFGLAHVAFDDIPLQGWQIGKVTTSSISGLVLGYAYVYYGITGAVLLHWAFNYFTSAYHYFDCSLLGGVSSCASVEPGLISSFLEYSLIVAGLVTLLTVGKVFLSFFHRAM
ncbi:MAG: CPBP family intramembrane metalloprotease [Thaumarchaeota archaeon]|nr:CPBP family intramembrane metalloprotease [Nitrososphaerota archaeon]